MDWDNICHLLFDKIVHREIRILPDDFLLLTEQLYLGKLINNLVELWCRNYLIKDHTYEYDHCSTDSVTDSTAFFPLLIPVFIYSMQTVPPLKSTFFRANFA